MRRGCHSPSRCGRRGAGATEQLRELHALLLESRRYGAERRPELAERHAGHFGFPAPALERYWRDLVYELDAAMIEGLRTFYALAAEIGELERAPELRWADLKSVEKRQQ